MDSENPYEMLMKELKDTEYLYRDLKATYDRSVEEMERLKENLKVIEEQLKEIYRKHKSDRSNQDSEQMKEDVKAIEMIKRKLKALIVDIAKVKLEE